MESEGSGLRWKELIRVMVKIIITEDIEAAVASYVADISPTVVAVSGGSMPKSLRGIKDLANWNVFFADERCVPLDSVDSNYKANGFLVPLVARMHPIADLPPAEAAAQYARELKEAGGLDLALLGAGPDGHTASLFPGHPVFTEATEEWCLPVYDSPKPPATRITLTLPALKAAKHVAFIATGASKAPLLASLFDSEHRPLHSDLPVAALDATWFVDPAAASLIRTPL